MGKLVKGEQERAYVKVYNDIIYEPNLSLKAKGLWAYLYAKPDNWDFAAERIQTESKDGIDSVKSALRELEQFGLLTRTKYQNNKGHWDYDYEIHTIPKVENPVVEIPSTGNPTLEKPTEEKPPNNKERIQIHNNKENNNKDISLHFDEGKVSKPKAKDETEKEKVCKKSHKLLIDYWCNEYKPEYVFSGGKDASAIKRIIIKLYDFALKKNKLKPTTEIILSMFKKICWFIYTQNTFYSTMDLSKVDSNFNSILSLMIKSKETKQQSNKNLIGDRRI